MTRTTNKTVAAQTTSTHVSTNSVLAKHKFATIFKTVAMVTTKLTVQMITLQVASKTNSHVRTIDAFPSKGLAMDLMTAETAKTNAIVPPNLRKKQRHDHLNVLNINVRTKTDAILIRIDAMDGMIVAMDLMSKDARNPVVRTSSRVVTVAAYPNTENATNGEIVAMVPMKLIA